MKVYVITANYYNGGQGDIEVIKVIENEEDTKKYIEEKNKDKNLPTDTEYFADPYEVE